MPLSDCLIRYLFGLAFALRMARWVSTVFAPAAAFALVAWLLTVMIGPRASRPEKLVAISLPAMHRAGPWPAPRSVLRPFDRYGYRGDRSLQRRGPFRQPRQDRRPRLERRWLARSRLPPFSFPQRSPRTRAACRCCSI